MCDIEVSRETGSKLAGLINSHTRCLLPATHKLKTIDAYFDYVGSGVDVAWTCIILSQNSSLGCSRVLLLPSE